MDKKKILIVCKGFYPEYSPRAMRATELAKEFARQGHDVTVLTHERNYDYSDFLKENQNRITIKSFGKLSWRPLQKSSWKFIGDKKRKLGRLLYMLLNYPDIEIMGKLKKALKHEKNYDLMISIAVPYPIHWGVAWSRTHQSPIAKTWVADCGDPFMGVTLESFRFPFYFAFLEKWFSRKADYITVPTEGAIPAYYPEFHYKIKVIPQGFNFDQLKLENEVKDNGIPTFAYAGGVSENGVRSPKKIIQYLIAKDEDFRFHIYSTSNPAILQAYVDKEPDRIIVHKPLPRKDLLLELSKMDFLLNLDNGVAHQKPSKLIDYALTQKPILNLIGEKPDYNLIDEFLTGNYSNRYIVSDIDNYNIKKVTREFLALN